RLRPNGKGGRHGCIARPARFQYPRLRFTLVQPPVLRPPGGPCAVVRQLLLPCPSLLCQGPMRRERVEGGLTNCLYRRRRALGTRQLIRVRLQPVQGAVPPMLPASLRRQRSTPS